MRHLQAPPAQFYHSTEIFPWPKPTVVSPMLQKITPRDGSIPSSPQGRRLPPFMCSQSPSISPRVVGSAPMVSPPSNFLPIDHSRRGATAISTRPPVVSEVDGVYDSREIFAPRRRAGLTREEKVEQFIRRESSSHQKHRWSLPEHHHVYHRPPIVSCSSSTVPGYFPPVQKGWFVLFGSAKTSNFGQGELEIGKLEPRPFVFFDKSKDIKFVIFRSFLFKMFLIFRFFLQCLLSKLWFCCLGTK